MSAVERTRLLLWLTVSLFAYDHRPERNSIRWIADRPIYCERSYRIGQTQTTSLPTQSLLYEIEMDAARRERGDTRNAVNSGKYLWRRRLCEQYRSIFAGRTNRHIA